MFEIQITNLTYQSYLFLRVMPLLCDFCLLICLLLRTALFVFYLGPLAIQFQVLGLLVLGMNFISWSGPYINPSLTDCSHKLCAALLQHIYRQAMIGDQKICVWVGAQVCPLVEYIPILKRVEHKGMAISRLNCTIFFNIFFVVFFCRLGIRLTVAL